MKLNNRKYWEEKLSIAREMLEDAIDLGDDCLQGQAEEAIDLAEEALEGIQ